MLWCLKVAVDPSNSHKESLQSPVCVVRSVKPHTNNWQQRRCLGNKGPPKQRCSAFDSRVPFCFRIPLVMNLGLCRNSKEALCCPASIFLSVCLEVECFVQRSKWQPLRTEQRRKRTTHKHAKTRGTQLAESRKQLSGKAGTTLTTLNSMARMTCPRSCSEPLRGSSTFRASARLNSKASSVNSCALRAEREALTLKKK